VTLEKPLFEIHELSDRLRLSLSTRRRGVAEEDAEFLRMSENSGERRQTIMVQAIIDGADAEGSGEVKAN
jgi:hypothetical protein